MGRKKKKKSNYSELENEDEEPLMPNNKAKGKKNKEHKQKQHHGPNRKILRNSQKNEDDEFRESLEADGSKTIVAMEADGNCLFRSLSDQLYYDHGNHHEEIRSDVCDYIEGNKDEFVVFLVLDENEEDEDAANFEEYVAYMRESGEWGGNVELVATARLYRRNIKVFSQHLAAYTIEHGQKKAGGPDLMVSYHDNDHYNSVRDARISKPPPPIKFAMQSIEKKGEEVVADNESLSLDDTASAKTKATDEETTSSMTDLAKHSLEEEDSKKARKKTKKKKKRSAPCPCGSGVMYRDCCRKRDKQERMERTKERLRQEREGTDELNEATHEMEGDFKVLKI